MLRRETAENSLSYPGWLNLHAKPPQCIPGYVDNGALRPSDGNQGGTQGRLRIPERYVTGRIYDVSVFGLYPALPQPRKCACTHPPGQRNATQKGPCRHFMRYGQAVRRYRNLLREKSHGAACGPSATGAFLRPYIQTPAKGLNPPQTSHFALSPSHPCTRGGKQTLPNGSAEKSRD